MISDYLRKHKDNFLQVHFGLHNPAVREISILGKTYQFILSKDNTRDFRSCVMQHGWKAVTQNMAKRSSSNTQEVLAAQRLGQKLWLTWIFYNNEYVGKISTLISQSGEEVQTLIEDLTTKQVIYARSAS